MPGKLFTWGQASFGRLGNGTTTPDVLVPTQIGTDTDWDQISTNDLSSFNLSIRNGQLWGWGNNAARQLGDGSTTNRTSPVLINSDTDWQMVSAGGEFSLAIKGGKLYAWGVNGNSQTGNGGTSTVTTPTQIGSDTNWSIVAAGSTHSLGIKTDGTLWAWGSNGNGRTGLNTSTGSTSTPTQVGSDTNWSKIICGGNYSLAIKTTGSLWAWGSAASGRLGNGTTTPDVLVPAQIGSDTNWSKIAAGGAHSFAIKTTGTLWAWGLNTNGRLGDGTTTQRTSPVQIGSSSSWQEISAGDNHSLGIDNGGLYSWGSPLNGRLGNNTTTPDVTSPTQIGSDTDWQIVFAGNTHSIASKVGVILPANTVAPSVSGTAKVGQTLTTTDGTWTGTPTPSYTRQWQVSDNGTSGWSNISGATSSTYVITSSEASKYIRSKITATNDAGAVDAFSSATAQIVQDPTNTIAPAITGTAKVGQILTTDNGTWQGFPNPSYTIAWQVSANGSTGWTSISGATSSTYTITASEAGQYIRSKISATNTEATVDAFSSATAQITQNPTNTVQPVVTGIKKVGETLTTDDGTWQAYPAATYAYQWQVSNNGTSNWSNISGATSSTYNLTASEAGKYLRSRVTATNTEESVSAVSDATTVINQDPTNTVAPVITGTAKVGETLTTDNGTWQSYPAATYAYQWQSSNDSGSSWSNISGATSGNFTPLTAQAGLIIRVKVTATNSEDSVDAFSSATSNVLENPAIDQVIINDLPAKVGDELTASASATAGYPAASISYQWFRNTGESYNSISGANTANYTPTSTDAGLILKVIATATNSEGSDSSEEVTEETLWAPANTSIPTITHPNHLEIGENLTADPGEWTGYPDPESVGFAYQWQVSDDGDTNWTNVLGETGDELYLDESFAAKYVRIKVTATTTAGTADAFSVTTGFISQDPEVLETPLINGITEIDEVLTVDPGEWGGFPNPNFSYQWERSANGSTNWVFIDGETEDQLTLTSSEVSFFIRCLVTGTNPVGSTTAASEVVGPVLQTPFLIDEPEITGNARQLQTLTLNIGEWGGFEDPTLDVDISWEISPDNIGDWETIEGADEDSYLIPEDDDLFGYYIRALVDVNNSAGSLAEYSNSLGPIDYLWTLPEFIEGPEVDGTNRVNSTLEVSFDFDGYPAATAFIQWQRQEEGEAWENVAGEEGTTYLIQEIDLDYVIRAQVTLINDEGSTVAYSDPTEQIEPELVGPVLIDDPEIQGSFEVSKKLTAYLGDYEGYPDPELAEDGLIWEYAADPDGPWRPVQEIDQEINWIPDEDFVGYYLRLNITVENVVDVLTVVSDHFGPIIPRLYVQPQVLPVTNARLISIHSQNGGNIGVEFDSEFTLDNNEKRNTLLWHGNSDAYLRFKTAVKYSSGQMDKIKETTVLIPKFIEVDQGTVLTIFYNKKTYTYRVADVTEINQDPAMAPMLKCVLVDPGFSDDPQFED
jgi:alpha-tubulin suppressor-like RCC1 family protein